METQWVMQSLIGGGLALLGVIVTQWFANRRERATWKRERERERERWEREDQLRTFEHRRAVYVEFYESLRDMQQRVYEHTNQFPDVNPEIAEGWTVHAWEKLQLLELYATPNIRELANQAYVATAKWGQRAEPGGADEEFDNNRDISENAKIALREAIRADLAVAIRP